MKILWMTSLRPLGKSVENDKIQENFINSILDIKENIKFSLSQFDDHGVKLYVKKKKINSYYRNTKKKDLPLGKKYSNKIMLSNALEQFLKFDFNYLVYSTADVIVPSNLFNEIKKIKHKKDFCTIVYPNILIKNGIVTSTTKPHYGIDIFIFKIGKKNVKKIIKSIKFWDQYDWGINDNFYVSLCELLKIPIYNIYSKVSVLKYENDFKTVKEDRNWQILSWKENQKYFLNFLKKNNLPSFYGTGSYYYLLLKIFKFSDINFKLFIVYLRFYFSLPFQITKKLFNKFFL